MTSVVSATARLNQASAPPCRRSFTIRDLEIYPPLVLAPMSGVTDTSFRQLIKAENPGAVGLVMTEFISVEGLTRENRRSVEMMRFAETERPVAIQIFGYDINRMAAAAEMVERAGADLVDINCGCPVPKVVRRGGGCELMRHPEHLAELVRAVAQRVSIPVTVKIRAGWDSSSRNAVAVARIVEQAGASMLSVHGRTRAEAYRGNADWALINEVAAAVSIPVVGNGDIVDVPSAGERLESGVAGLMIGRGAMVNPWLFSEIFRWLQGLPPDIRRTSEIADVILRYEALLAVNLPEKAILGRMKQFGSQATRLVQGSGGVRKMLCRSQSREEFRDLLLAWRQVLASERRSEIEQAGG